MCFEIGFDIHKTRCDAREEGQDARYRNLWDLIVNNDDISFKHIHSEIEFELISNSCTE